MTFGGGEVTATGGEVAEFGEGCGEAALQGCVGGVCGGKAFGDGMVLGEVVRGGGDVALGRGEVAEFV